MEVVSMRPQQQVAGTGPMSFETQLRALIHPLMGFPILIATSLHPATAPTEIPRSKI